MLVLGLDTATFTASAALVDGDGAVLADGELDTSARGDDLLVLLDDVCRRADVAPTALTAVAVGAGPGSFTGLRIGMATAKGIAFAAGAPLWPVSSLAAMAAEAAALVADAALLVPVLDARRGEVFLGTYQRAEGGALREVHPEAVLAPEQVAAAVAAASPEAPTYFGDALAVHATLAPLAPRWLAAARTPAGVWIARLALAGRREDALRGGRPAYLRPAEAEVKYPDGVPGAKRVIPLPEPGDPPDGS
ncbi:MAG: tRNA (adenosine(37)-N6)-threonylcarbamoyltransferase complex dimerization subunit type 1 TsaB [Kofleriaceae bacterium]